MRTVDVKLHENYGIQTISVAINNDERKGQLFFTKKEAQWIVSRLQAMLSAIEPPEVAAPECSQPAKSQPIRGALLDEAKALTLGDRNRRYGDPMDNLRRMAKIEGQLRIIEGAQPYDMAMQMLSAKLSRIPSSPGHKDNYLDAINYLAIAWEVLQRQHKE